MIRNYHHALQLTTEDQGPRTDDPLQPSEDVEYHLEGQTICYDHSNDKYAKGERRWRWHLFVHRLDRYKDDSRIVANLQDEVDYPHPLPCAQAMEARAFTPVELLGVRWYDLPGLELKHDHRPTATDVRHADVEVRNYHPEVWPTSGEGRPSKDTTSPSRPGRVPFGGA